MEVLHLSQAEILRYILYFFPVSFLISILFIWKELRSDIGSSFKKQNLTMALETKLSPSPLAFLTPILPVFLVLFFGIRAFFEPKPNEAFQFPIITAMFIAIVFGTFVSPKEAGPKIQMLTRSIFDGIKNVAPAIALMVGIGILLKTVTHPVVKTLLAPSMLSILPSTSAGYILFFVFAAPLTLYRGPLNMWGMGSGIIALMQDTKLIPAAAIMAALLSVGQIQGVSDPTNTYNVWIANYLGVDVIKILKRTILWMWVCALFGLIVSSLLYYQTVPGVNQ
jgi:hypothetical protein